jgi:sugar lactone lactonase YvrE
MMWRWIVAATSIADTNNDRILRVVAETGVITTVAGNGTAGYSGDGGPAPSASLNSPVGVVVDNNGNLYIADYENYRVRKVAADSGVITTIAGNGTAGYSGDGGVATSAALRSPYGVAVDVSGNVYIADGDNYRIRKVAADSGVITTVAGNGSPGYTGDGGPATIASLEPSRIAVDNNFNLYIADADNNVIRCIAADTGVIMTLAGNGSTGYSGDSGPATNATLNAPYGMALDGSGSLYIADSYNDRVRIVNLRTPQGTAFLVRPGEAIPR